MENVVDSLAGGDRRSLGRANMVVKGISRDPKLFSLVFEAMLHNDPVVRMRAADAIEKVTVSRPEFLQVHKRKLLGKVAGAGAARGSVACGVNAAALAVNSEGAE